jgi:cyanophycin synthetase
VILKEDADRRGRRPGEIAALMREGARAGGLPDSAIEEVLEERAAVRRLVDAARGRRPRARDLASTCRAC